MNNKKFAVVVSRFNSSITEKLLQGTMTRFNEVNINPQHITVCHVPGAIEIPLLAKRLAEQKKHHAIICLGAVIRGETTHYDYVCQQVSYGCQRVALDHTIPVIFGVLTTENKAQALDRLGGAHGHKGEEAVDCALETLACLDSLN